MLKQQKTAHLGEEISTRIPPSHARVRRKRRVFVLAAGLGLLLVMLNLVSGQFAGTVAYAQPVPATIQLKGSPSTPNTAWPNAGAQSLTRTQQVSAPGSAKPGTPQTITHNTKMAMNAGSVDLQVGKAVSFLGSDGRLELQIPAGAITAQDLQAAGGKSTAQVTQIAPASGSNAGGSGSFSLGTYLVQSVDAHGRAWSAQIAHRTLSHPERRARLSPRPYLVTAQWGHFHWYCSNSGRGPTFWQHELEQYTGSTPSATSQVGLQGADALSNAPDFNAEHVAFVE